MDDITSKIIKRIADAGKLVHGSTLMESGYQDWVGVYVGQEGYRMFKCDANEADARKLAHLIGVDVSDL